MLRNIVKHKSIKRLLSTSVMESGVYNDAAFVQTSVQSSTNTELIESINRIKRNFITDPTIYISDLGCSHGINSMLLLNTIVNQFRLPDDPSKDIVCVHNDLPSNDWTSFIETLNNKKVSYLHESSRGRSFGFIAPQSFYEPLFPQSYLHFTVSYICLHWLSELPCTLPSLACNIQYNKDYLISNHNNIYLKWKSWAHNDITNWLKLRANELKDKGELCVVMVSNPFDSDISRGLYKNSKSLFDFLAIAMRDMLKSNIITEEEYNRFTIPYYLRTVNEVHDAAAAVSTVLEMKSCKDFIEKLSFVNGEELADFILSIHGPCVKGCLDILDSGSERKQYVYDECRRHISSTSQRELYVSYLYVSFTRIDRKN